MLSTQDLLTGPWMGAMFFGIMLGGSMRMPGLQTILIELTGKEIRGRLMAMSMIVSNMTMGLGGFWSTGLLSMENGYLRGMDQTGLVSMLTLLVVILLLVPPLVLCTASWAAIHIFLCPLIRRDKDAFTTPRRKLN